MNFKSLFSKQPYYKLSAKDAKATMDSEEVVVLDVREPFEFQQGHISQAVNIPVSTIQKTNQNLPELDQKVLVYCRSGSRSQKAAKKLAKLGYTQVYDFGGLIDWPYDVKK